MRKVGDLQALHEKYYDDGFRVIAIADDPPAEVRETMDDRGAKYWIGLDTDKDTLGRYAGSGALGIPQYYLVDVEGVVVRSGMPSEDEIQALLKRVFEPALGRELHDLLAEACAEYERDAAGAAWKEAGEFLGHDDEEVVEGAEFLREKVEKYLAWQKERIEKALAKDDANEAMGELLVFELRFAKMDDVDWAKDQLKALKKHDDIHAERFAWSKLRKALAKEAKGVGSRGKRKSVCYAYEKILKKHKGTVAARIAKKRMEALEEK